MEEKNYTLPASKLPPEIGQWLEELAKSERRSVSAQIIFMLEKIKDESEKGEVK